MASRTVLKIAARLARSYEQDYLDYLAACEEWRKEGYRPHYCEHGTNLWTDYDNICGPCEDGLSMRDGVFRRQYALSEAKSRDEQATALVRALSLMIKEGIDVDQAKVWTCVTELLAI